MKKIIAISLVAILAVGSVFAAFSGSATVGAGANFDNGNYGFIDNSTKVNFNIELASANAEAQAEGDVYASVKASLSIFTLTGKGGVDPFDKDPSDVANVGFGITASIDEAKIAGENWYVSLLGAGSRPDFAKSAIDTWTKDDTDSNKYGVKAAGSSENATYAVGYEEAPGVEVGVYDYVVGVGFVADAQSNPNVNLINEYALSLYAKTPEYDFDGFKLQAGASYATSTNYEGVDAVNALGGGVKLGYSTDTVTVAVASDLGYDFNATDNGFGADVAANVAYADVVTVDAYYATAAINAKNTTVPVKNLLSFKVASDLNSFDVPVSLSFTGKDMINSQNMKLAAEFAVADVTLTPSVGYVVKDKTFTAGIEAAYTHEVFTVKGAFSAETKEFKGTPVLGASASIETSALVPGATLALAWSDANDLLNDDPADHTENLGKLIASVSVEF